MLCEIDKYDILVLNKNTKLIEIMLKSAILTCEPILKILIQLKQFHS